MNIYVIQILLYVTIVLLLKGMGMTLQNKSFWKELIVEIKKPSEWFYMFLLLSLINLMFLLFKTALALD